MRPVRLVLSEYPDCEGSSLPANDHGRAVDRARQMHRKADEPQEEFRGGEHAAVCRIVVLPRRSSTPESGGSDGWPIWTKFTSVFRRSTTI